MSRGLLLVISGPAGSGKGTVIKYLMEKERDIAYSVSATTRSPRPGEVDGVNYHFISVDEFKSRIEHGGILEYTEYCGNFYGTPKKEAEDVLDAGKNLILEIEVEGAANVKRICPDAVLIMLLPPSHAEQERRLRGRGTEPEDKILARLAQAREEIKQLQSRRCCRGMRAGHFVHYTRGETEPPPQPRCREQISGQLNQVKKN